LVEILGFAALWFLAGYLSALLVGRFVNLPWGPVQFGLLGLIVGLVALVPKLQSEHGRRLFFEGPEIDEDGDPILGCLWLIPLQILLLTLLGWAGWFISRWLFN
jgi:hypothetical protein